MVLCVYRRPPTTAAVGFPHETRSTLRHGGVLIRADDQKWHPQPAARCAAPHAARDRRAHLPTHIPQPREPFLGGNLPTRVGHGQKRIFLHPFIRGRGAYNITWQKGHYFRFRMLGSECQELNKTPR